MHTDRRRFEKREKPTSLCRVVIRVYQWSIPIVFLLLVSVAAYAQASQPAKLALKDIHGRALSLSDYRGSVVLVNFWATWCVPCGAEIPDLIKLQRKYRNRGLRIIGVTYPPEKLSEVRRFARQLRMNYRVALGTKASKSLFTPSETLPFSVIIDRDGVVRDLIEGIMYAEEFNQKVKPLLLVQRRRSSTGL